MLPELCLESIKSVIIKITLKKTFGSKIYMQPLDPYYLKKVNISQFLVLNQRKNVNTFFTSICFALPFYIFDLS